MTPRSFWTIVLKITGIYFAIQSFTTLWKSMNIVIIYSSLGSMMTHYHFFMERIEFVMIAAIILFVIYILICYYCLFKTEWIIYKLKLDKGFGEEKFEFSLHHSTILKMATIIIGGLLLASIVPDFINECFIYFQKVEKYHQLEHNRNSTFIITDFVRIIIGLFLLIRSTSIVNFIERRSKPKPVQIEDTEPI